MHFSVKEMQESWLKDFSRWVLGANQHMTWSSELTVELFESV